MTEKNFIDKLFDVAESALDPVERVLRRDDPPASQKQKSDVIDAEFEDHKDRKDDRREDWEKSFDEIQWASVDNLGGHWHAFRKGQVVTACGKTAKLTSSRQVLDHDRFITACTSCIIAVSK